jgi:hypothetical protein
MKLTPEQMQAGWDAWQKAKNDLPLFDMAAQAALFAAAKADIETGGDMAAVKAALQAVDVKPPTVLKTKSRGKGK